MQRGFGVSKHLLIGTVWLGFGEVHHRVFLFMLHVLYCCQQAPSTVKLWLPEDQADKTWKPDHTQTIKRICSFLRLSHTCRSIVCPHQSGPSSSKTTYLFFQLLQWFSITLLLGWLWPLNQPIWEESGLASAKLSNASITLSSFFPLTLSPFHLVLAMRTLSAQKYIIIHLHALIVSPSGVSYVSAVCTL